MVRRVSTGENQSKYKRIGHEVWDIPGYIFIRDTLNPYITRLSAREND